MNGTNKEARFLAYQIKAIRRFQRIREPSTPEDAQRLALEWIYRFAGPARSRWNRHWQDRQGSVVRRIN